MNLNLNDVDVPEDPVLGRGPVRDVMGHRVPPRRQPTIGPEEVTVAGLELQVVTFPDWLPLDGGVKPSGQGLQHLPTRHAQQEGLVGCGQVLPAGALQAYDGFGTGHELDGPPGVLGGTVSVLVDGLLVFLGQEVLLVVAAEPHRLGVVEEVHPRPVLVRRNVVDPGPV